MLLLLLLVIAVAASATARLALLHCCMGSPTAAVMLLPWSWLLVLRDLSAVRLAQLHCW
jgi:hypothetical protein